MNKQIPLKIFAWTLNLALIIMCLGPFGASAPQPFQRSDLMYHAIAYGGLFIVFASAHSSVLGSFLFLAFQGVAIEFIQPYFERHFEWLDMIANTLGLLLGYAAVTLYSKWREPSPKNETGPAK